MGEKKEIIEGNKLIAEFMNWQHHENKGYDEFEMKHLKYHSSWNELMPVLLKISDIHYPDYWNGRQPDGVGEWDNCAYPRTFGMRDSEGNYMVRLNANVLHSAKTLIEATWLAVTDFIEDYNKTQQSK